MVICKFYQQGNCRFGNSCRYEHTTGGGSRFGALAGGSQPNGGNLGTSRAAERYKITTEAIESDLTSDAPLWILSAYAPGRDAPGQLFGGSPREQSFEEMRLHHVIGAAGGTEQQAIKEAQDLYATAQSQMQNALKDLQGAVDFVANQDNEHPNRHDICQQGTQGQPFGEFAVGNRPNPQSASSNPFGGGSPQTTSAFGQPSSLGQKPNPFGQPAQQTQGSAFGQPSQLGGGGSAFGQPSQLGSGGGSAFGHPSQLGAKPNPFGQSSQAHGSTFGQPSQPGSTGSAFGQPSQLGGGGGSGSAFGQPSQLGAKPNPFGQPSQTQGSAFGQPARPGNTGSAFGQPSQPGPQQSAFGQPSQMGAKPNPFGQTSQTQGSTFGQPSQPGNTGSAFGQPSQMGQKPNLFGSSSTNTASPAANPFASASGNSNNNASPFAAAGNSQTDKPNPFGQPAQNQEPAKPNPFGQPSQPAQGSAFGKPIQIGAKPNPFAAAQNNTQPANNPFASQTQQQQQPNGAFGKPPANANQTQTGGEENNPYPPDSARTHPPVSSYTTKGMDGQLASFRDKPVSYKDGNPGIKQFDGAWQRIWFPSGPPTYNKDTALPVEDYDAATKEAWEKFAQTGDFADGVMPELPPPRDCTLWNF